MKLFSILLFSLVLISCDKPCDDCVYKTVTDEGGSQYTLEIKESTKTVNVLSKKKNKIVDFSFTSTKKKKKTLGKKVFEKTVMVNCTYKGYCSQCKETPDGSMECKKPKNKVSCSGNRYDKREYHQETYKEKTEYYNKKELVVTYFGEEKKSYKYKTLKKGTCR